MITQEELYKVVSGAIGKKILQINSGGSTGSIFTLQIGDELIESKVGSRTFNKGEYSMMVYCAWRLFDSKLNKPITGWQEDSRPDGPLTSGLNTLHGDIIEQFLITSFNDIAVLFRTGKVLSIFCDLTMNVEWGTNWFFRANGKHYSIGRSLACIAE